MNKNEFMRKLKECLVGMNQTDKREILLDYEEHFLDGIKEGRTEEEISASLGDPKDIAANLKKASAESSRNTDGVNTAGYIIGIIALAFGCIWLVGFVVSLLGTLLGGAATLAVVSVLPLSAAIKFTVICALVLTLSVGVMIIFGLIKLTVLIIRWFTTMINGLTVNEEKRIKKEVKMIKFPAWLWIVLAVLAVLSLGGVIYGGINFGIDMAEKYQNGELDQIITDIERFEDWDDLDDIDDIDDIEFFFESFESLDDYQIWHDAKSIVPVVDNLGRGCWFMGFFNVGASRTVLDTQNLDLTGISEVEITASSAAVSVKSGDEAQAVLTGRSLLKSEKITLRQTGSTLKISIQDRVWSPGTQNLQLEVVLPEGLDTLSVKTSSGSTSVDEIQANVLDLECSSGLVRVDGGGYGYDEILLKSSSGLASLNNVSDANMVKLQNTSGMVKIEDVTADSFIIKSSSGSVHCDRITGNLEVDATSGNVNIDGALGTGSSRIECSSGRISLNLEKTPMKITASTSSGRISIQDTDMFSVSLLADHEFVGEYGDGTEAKADLTVKATSGSVNIDFK